MKRLICIAMSIVFLSFFSCKKTSTESMTVLKNCTGVYLRFENKIYHVCNPEMVSSFGDGTSVTATFRKIKECNGSAKDAIVCMMVFRNDGWVEVEQIK